MSRKTNKNRINLEEVLKISKIKKKRVEYECNNALEKLGCGFVQTVGMTRYEVRPKVLGKGANATVYEGKNLADHRRVAVKVLEVKTDIFEENNEIKALLLLKDHPNVIRLRDAFCLTHGGKNYQCLALAYHGRGNLYEIMVRKKGSRYPESVAYALFSQLTSALRYMHSLRIIHRDLKLENLMLDDEDNVVLVDFGYASVYEDGVRPTGSCGSIHYACPELLLDAFYEGPEADLWASFVILFILLMGCLPFNENYQVLGHSLTDQIVRSIYRFPSFTDSPPSEDSKVFIKRGLTPNRGCRIKHADFDKDPWMSHWASYYEGEGAPLSRNSTSTSISSSPSPTYSSSSSSASSSTAATNDDRRGERCPSVGSSSLPRRHEPLDGSSNPSFVESCLMLDATLDHLREGCEPRSGPEEAEQPTETPKNDNRWGIAARMEEGCFQKESSDYESAELATPLTPSSSRSEKPLEESTGGLSASKGGGGGEKGEEEREEGTSESRGYTASLHNIKNIGRRLLKLVQPHKRTLQNDSRVANGDNNNNNRD